MHQLPLLVEREIAGPDHRRLLLDRCFREVKKREATVDGIGQDDAEPPLAFGQPLGALDRIRRIDSLCRRRDERVQIQADPCRQVDGVPATPPTVDERVLRHADHPPERVAPAGVVALRVLEILLEDDAVGDLVENLVGFSGGPWPGAKVTEHRRS